VVGSGRGLSEVLPCPSRPRENHKKNNKSGQLVFWLRFKPGTSQIKIAFYISVLSLGNKLNLIRKHNSKKLLFLQSFWVPSIATVLLERFLLLTLHNHYMFQALRTIFRWNIYTGYFGLYGPETCSGYVIVIIKKSSKSTVAIDGNPKDCSNRSNRIQPSKIKNYHSCT
jgi:hypothetical protein